MWDVKQKGTNRKACKLIDPGKGMVVTRAKRAGEVEEGKGGQLYGDSDGRRLDFGW